VQRIVQKNDAPAERAVQSLKGDGPAAAKFRGIVAISGLLITLMLAHYPMIFSGFAQTQSDPVDGRLNNYFLEHGWKWVTLQAGHGGFWNEPFFYPAANVAAYSDVMLSFVPLYAPWRMLGFSPDTAMQWWMISATAMNFAAAYLLLRRGLKCGPIAAAAGAALFGAAAPRVSQMLHAQLACVALPVLAIYALYEIFEPSGPAANRKRYIVLFFAAIALQAWGGFYNAFFLLLLLSIAGLFALIVKNLRVRLLQVLFGEWLFVSAVAIGVVILMSPWLVHYLSALHQQGNRSYEDVSSGLAKPWAWISPGPFNVVYRHLTPRLGTDGDVESAVGCGLVTSIVAIAGLWIQRKRKGIKLLVVCGIAAIALTTVFFGRFSLWWMIYRAVPGAGAIRQASRISSLVLLPIAVGVALMVDWFLQLRAGALTMTCAVALAIACLAEQTVGGLSFPKAEDRQRVAAIVEAVPSEAKCFYYSGPAYSAEVAQVDAMWASVQSSVPTLNGYSGCAPPDYPLSNANVTSSAEQQDLLSSLKDWSNSQGLDAGDVLWIVAGDNGPLQAVKVSTADKDLVFPKYPKLALGERLNFNDEKMDPYLGDGWSYREPEFRWTDGQVAQIHFSLSWPLPRSNVLSLTVQPMLGATVSAQRVEVRLNGRVIHSESLSSEHATIVVPIPDDCLARDNLLELQLPDATITKDDGRRLGLAAEWISLDTAPEQSK
jgi:hypothetical protein